MRNIQNDRTRRNSCTTHIHIITLYCAQSERNDGVCKRFEWSARNSFFSLSRATQRDYRAKPLYGRRRHIGDLLCVELTLFWSTYKHRRAQALVAVRGRKANILVCRPLKSAPAEMISWRGLEKLRITKKFFVCRR